MILVYEKLKPGAYAPTKEYPEDAGWDVRALSSYALHPGQRANQDRPGDQAPALRGSGAVRRLANGLSWYWRVAGKAGLAEKTGIHVLGGVVDRNYRGEVGIIVQNLGFWDGGRVVHEAWIVKPGDKVAQIIPELIADCRQASEGPLVPLTAEPMASGARANETRQTRDHPRGGHQSGPMDRGPARRRADGLRPVQAPEAGEG